MATSLRHAAGSLLVVGVSNTELSALERAWLKLVRPGGIILFRRNIADAKQTRALLTEAGSYCTQAHLRCVDVEGGTVDRLREAVAAMPSAHAVAKTGKVALMNQQGALIAREVMAFGFNTTLAPVLDLGLAASASVMGTRTAGTTAESVVGYTRAFLSGLAKHGVVGCGKHFPGLGGGSLDSHQETPTIHRKWKQMWDEDMVPYRRLVRELPMIMVNHAAYPETRGGGRPATASSFWITDVLQRRMGYKGLIFSDDMEMGGILKFLPMEEAAIAALRAGIQMMEICHSAELILRCYESLIHEAERSAVFRKLLLSRAATVSRLRARRFSEKISRALTGTEFEAMRKKVQRFSDAVEAAQPA